MRRNRCCRFRSVALGILVGIGSSLCASSLAWAEESDAVVNSASEEICGFVAGQTTNKLDIPVIAIVPFTHEDGSKSMEGQLICEQLIGLLTDRSITRIVERDKLAKALEEQKLASEGFISPETAVRAGKLTGARGILAGTITELGETVEVHARIFSVETGEVMATKNLRARRTIKTFINPLWDDIDHIKATGSKFKGRIWAERDRLRIGDTASLAFESERNCYVTIFDFATDGNITVLFPNKFQPDNKIEAGRRYQIPAENAGYKIRVRGPAGIERLKMFATTSDVQLYQHDYSQAPFSAIADGDQNFMRGLKVEVDRMAAPDWAEASCEFLIENVLR